MNHLRDFKFRLSRFLRRQVGFLRDSPGGFRPLRSQRYIALGLGTLILLLLLTLITSPVQSQRPTILPTPTATPTVAVNSSILNLQQLEQRLSQGIVPDPRGLAIARIRLNGYSLFAIAVQSGMDITTTTEALSQRRDSIETTLQRITQAGFEPQTLSVLVTVDTKSSLPILTINDQYLMTVTTLDAQLQGSVPERVANEYAEILKLALLRAHQETQPSTLLQQALWAVATFLVGLCLSRIVARFQGRFRQESPDPSAHISAASADQTAAQVAEMSRQRLQQEQHIALQEAKRRSLQLLQMGILGLSLYLILGMFPYTRWLQPIVVSTPLKVIVIGFCIYVGMRLSDTLIDHICQVFDDGQPPSRQASMRVDQRISTISRAGKSLASILLWSSGILATLAVLGVNLLPLLTGAGIVGLAISFAAQSVIKDVINGLLILFEDQYAVGDVITVGAVGGMVENMNLRITQLRNNEGQLITIPNSAISVVQNLSKDWARVDLTLQVSLQADANTALAVLRELAQAFYQDPFWQPKLLDRPEILGIDELTHAGMLIRIWIKTRPLEQWVVAREFRRRLQALLQTTEVEIGIPQQLQRLQAPLHRESTCVDFPPADVEPSAPNASDGVNVDETQSNHSELKHQTL